MNFDAAFELFKPYFDRSWLAAKRAGQRYDNITDKIDQCSRTKACLQNDYVFKEMLVEFDDDGAIEPQYESWTNSRYISVNDAALLWVKKVDDQRAGTNYPTQRARDMVGGQATFDFLPQADLIVLGYQFNEKSDLMRLSFSPPTSGRTPIWYIDLEPSGERIVEMRPQTTGTEILRTPSGLKITRGGRQMGLDGIQS
jgi:predicted Rdx family selenoprotein